MRAVGARSEADVMTFFPNVLSENVGAERRSLPRPGGTRGAEEARAMRTAERTRLIARRRNLPAEERRRLSGRIQSLVLSDARWRAARVVALYVAANGEVETGLLLDSAWAAGKTVLLPRCLPRDPADPPEAGGRMEFVACSSREDLVPGRYGLLEPGPACRRVAGAETPDAIALPDLAVLPAVGLRPDGARLGYGGGYYDRAFSRPGWGGTPRLALIYAFQLVAFPVDERDASAWPDVAAHGYATENELAWLQDHFFLDAPRADR